MQEAGQVEYGVLAWDFFQIMESMFERHGGEIATKEIYREFPVYTREELNAVFRKLEETGFVAKEVETEAKYRLTKTPRWEDVASALGVDYNMVAKGGTVIETKVKFQ